MTIKDMVCKKTDTEYDYIIMHVLEIKGEKVTCAWVDNAAIPQIKIFNVEELEIFVEG